MQKILPIFFCIILFVLILSAYCNTFYSPPVLDDYHSFIEDETVYIKDFSPSSLFSLSNTKFGWSRWIPMMTFAFDHRLGRGEIFHFHLTNFTIHILSWLAAMFLVFQVFKLYRVEDSFWGKISPIYWAIWISGLWALNPVQTNAVTYLVQRMASIQSLFYILCVSFFILARKKHLLQHNKSKSLFFYTASFLAGVCAFLSKQNAAMLPLMLLVTEVCFFQQRIFESLLEKIKKSNKIVMLIVLLGFFLTIVLFVKFFLILNADYATRNFNMWQRVLTEARIVIWYITILIWPLPSRLSLEHDIDISTSLLNPPTTILSFLIIFFMIYFAFRSMKRFPIISYGIIWFFINLAIESTVISLELVFEHRLYLPSLGFYLVFVVVLVQVFDSLLKNASKWDFIKIVCSVFAIISASYCLLTFQRNEAWRDFLTFNQDVVSKAPLNSRAHSNLAVALAKAQKYEEAIKEAEIAIKLGYGYNVNYIVSASVIVGASIGLGNLEAAAEYGERLLNSRPEPCDANGLPNLCLQIAEAYRRMGQLKRACSYALLSMRYDQKLGGVSYEKKLITGMLNSILTASKDQNIDLDEDGHADPGDVPIKTWIAKEFLKCDGTEEAKNLLVAASLEKSNHLETQYLIESLEKVAAQNYVQSYKTNFIEKYVKNPFSRFEATMALAYLIRESQLSSPFLEIGERLTNYALNLQPYAADSHLLRGWYHFEKGEVIQAIECARRALQLDAQHAKVFLSLGFFLLGANDPLEGVAAFQKALELYPGYPQREVLRSLISEVQQEIVEREEKISRLKE